MTEVGSLKWIEAALLGAAGALFVWWQLRDVRQAQARSKAERERREAAEKADADPEPRP